MKQQKIIAFKKKDGRRTSVTLSDFQLETVDKIAEYKNMTRYQYLALIENKKPRNANLSSFIRDEIILELILKINSLT